MASSLAASDEDKFLERNIGLPGITQMDFAPEAKVEDAGASDVPKAEHSIEEGAICRICRCEAEPSRPLFHPCICTGSIKYVHESCLLEWLDHSFSNTKCELCGFRFGFTPIYQAGAPAKLPLLEIAKLSILRVMRSIPGLIRLALVILTWGIMVPISTFIMFRILRLGRLNRASSSQLQMEAVVQTGWSHIRSQLRIALEDGLYSGWVIGLCTTCCILLSFLTLVSVADYVREHTILSELIDELDQDDEESGEEFGIETDQIGELNDIDATAEDVRNAGNLNIPERRAAFGRVQGNDGVNDDWDGDFENENNGNLNVALDELLGLRGPELVLLHNFIWLLTFNGLYLCVFFSPAALGAPVIALLNRLWLAITEMLFGTAMRMAFFRDEASLLHAPSIDRGNGSSGAWSAYRMLQEFNIEKANILLMCSPGDREEEEKRLFFEEFHWLFLELFAMFIGYIIVACIFWLVHCLAIFLRKVLKSATEKRALEKVSRIFSITHRILKVLIIVFLKMGIFPMLLGFLLKYAGADLIRLPIDDYSFALAYPIFAFMVPWGTGITYMLFVTIIVLELREILHPSILHDVIRPKDTDESFIRTTLEDSVLQHLRRILLSCIIYAVLVGFFVYIPAKILKSSCWGDSLPYTLSMQYAVLEIHLPLELVAIHLCVLNVLDHGKDRIHDAIEFWFSTVCRYLGLTSYLLPVEISNDEEAEDNVEDADTVEDLGSMNGDGDMPLKASDSDNINESLRLLAEHAENDMNETNDNEEEEISNASSGEGVSNLKPRVCPPYCLPRVLCLIFFAWVSVLTILSTVLLVPLFTGRAAIHFLQIPLIHDPLVYAVGVVILWRCYITAIALKVHYAPLMAINAVKLILNGSSNQAWSFTRTFVREIQWIKFVAVCLVCPWLLGILIQLACLLPSNHPSLGFSSRKHVDGWTYVSQLRALIIALSGNAAQLSIDDVLNHEDLRKYFVDEGNKMKTAADIVDSMIITTSPFRDWFIGLIVGFAIVSFLLMPEVMAVRPSLHRIHMMLLGCVDDLITGHNCVSTLSILLSIFWAQVVGLAACIFLPPVADILAYAVSGYSAYNSLGIVSVCRHTLICLLVAAAMPILIAELEQVWKTAHKALRDERYLIGNRLHNMEYSSDGC